MNYANCSPPLNSRKLTLCLALAVLMAHATVHADIVSNSSYDTFQVIDNSYSFSPYELFNSAADQYTDGQSVATYNNSADFYADRGVRSLVSNWTVSEGSQIVGMYRTTTGFAHSVNLTNSTGTVWNPITDGQGAVPDQRSLGVHQNMLGILL